MAAWTTLTLIDGFDAIVYVQAAGVTATPGTADELGWITDFSLTNTQETTDKGPHINRNVIAKRRAGKTHEFSATLDCAEGAQAAKDVISSAFTGNTDVKLTIQIAPTTGDKHVYDNTVVTAFNLSASAADGHTYEITGASTSYTFTPDAS